MTADAPRSWLNVVAGLWAWLFLLLLIVFFGLTGQGFFTPFNFQNIGANMAILLIMAVGQTFVIISGGIDLSTGYVMGLASVVGALVMTNMPEGTPLVISVLAALVAGLAAGLITGFINGTLIARFRVPPFIVTLGMFGIARGVGFLFSGGMPVPAMIERLGRLGNGYLAYYHPEVGFSFFSPPTGLEGVAMRQTSGIMPNLLVLVIILLWITHWVLSRSQFGLHTYALGGNAEAATRAGIPVAQRTIMLYMLSASFAALAGFVYNLRFTNGAANAGEGLLLDSIAAVVIGGASLFGGAGTVIGTLIGALIIAVIQNGLVILSIDPFWQFVAVGIIIILAVFIDQARAQVVR